MADVLADATVLGHVIRVFWQTFGDFKNIIHSLEFIKISERLPTNHINVLQNCGVCQNVCQRGRRHDLVSGQKPHAHTRPHHAPLFPTLSNPATRCHDGLPNRGAAASTPASSAVLAQTPCQAAWRPACVPACVRACPFPPLACISRPFNQPCLSNRHQSSGCGGKPCARTWLRRGLLHLGQACHWPPPCGAVSGARPLLRSLQPQGLLSQQSGGTRT